LAEEALRRIGALYAVEAEVRGRPAEERRAGRQERSKPIVDVNQRRTGALAHSR
jgi:transposase